MINEPNKNGDVIDDKQLNQTKISSILDCKKAKQYASRLFNFPAMIDLKEKIDELVNELTPVNVENDNKKPDDKISFKQIYVPDIYNMTELVIEGIDKYPKPFVRDVKNKNKNTTGDVYKKYTFAKLNVENAKKNGITARPDL